MRHFGLLCIICALSFQHAYCAATWPNEPTGSTLVSDWGFNTLSGGGWVDGGASGIVSDAAAPYSPNNVLQFTYSSGMEGGGSPGQQWLLLPQLPTEIYVAFWWKASAGWQGHPGGVNKILYVCSNEGSGGAPFGITMDGVPGGPYHTKFFYQYSNPAVDNSQITGIPNSTSTFIVYGSKQIVPGTWYLIELYLKNSTTTNSKDGVSRWCVTPQGGQTVLDGDIRNMNTAVFQYASVNITPVWGGGAGVYKTQTDYYWFDHIRVSQPHNAILPPLPLAITTTLSSGRTGTPYSATLTAANGKAPYTWFLESGNLPAGLSLIKGVISGTPTCVGRSDFTLRVTDASVPALSTTRSYTVIVSGTSTSCPSPIVAASEARTEQAQFFAKAVGGKVTFNLPVTSSAQYRLSIYNLTGKKVYEHLSMGQREASTTKDLRNGVYFAKFAQGTRSSTVRFSVMN